MTPDLKRRLEANLPRLLVQKCLVTAYFQLPIIVLFWQDLGLSLMQIMLLQSAFAMATDRTKSGGSRVDGNGRATVWALRRCLFC